MRQIREKKPEIVVEDLQPKDTIAGYRATWKERGLIAYADLLPVDDMPARGFTLECGYDTVSGREPGNRQIDFGTTLTSKVRGLMLDQMARAGWVQIGMEKRTGQEIWQYVARTHGLGPGDQAVRSGEGAGQGQGSEQVGVTSEQASVSSPQDEKSRVLSVPAHRSAAYKRTIFKKAVAFTCARCGQSATREMYPGPAPLYCDACAQEVTREQTRARVARLRARKVGEMAES